jgi:hypothetical protein
MKLKDLGQGQRSKVSRQDRERGNSVGSVVILREKLEAASKEAAKRPPKEVEVKSS